MFLLIGVGVTLSFFTSTSELENEFKSGRYKTVSTDNFTSPSDWKPGDTTPKTITTKNEGTMPVRVRVKLTEEWKSENNNVLPLEYNNERVSIINFDNEDDWVKDGDYYYYIGELAPGEETSSLIESITYNPNTPSDMNCTSDNGVYNCKSTGDGYDGGTYTLNVTVETVQSDLAVSAWNLSKDPTIEEFAYNGSSLEYRIGDNIESYETIEDNYQATNKNPFLQYTVLGKEIKHINVGFIYNDNVYYLKGAGATYNEQGNYYNYDSIYYEENKSTLISTLGSENCTENEVSMTCTLHDGTSYIDASADASGNVFVEIDSWICGVYDGGTSNCFSS